MKARSRTWLISGIILALLVAAWTLLKWHRDAVDVAPLSNDIAGVLRSVDGRGLAIRDASVEEALHAYQRQIGEKAGLARPVMWAGEKPRGIWSVDRDRVQPWNPTAAQGRRVNVDPVDGDGVIRNGLETLENIARQAGCTLSEVNGRIVLIPGSWVVGKMVTVSIPVEMMGPLKSRVTGTPSFLAGLPKDLVAYFTASGMTFPEGSYAYVRWSGDIVMRNTPDQQELLEAILGRFYSGPPSAWEYIRGTPNRMWWGACQFSAY